MLIGETFPANITIETDIPSDLWVVEIDPIELQLSLLNLGFNARDAMPGGGLLRISAKNQALQDDRLGLAGRYVAIEVADTGSGIPPEILPRVFEPFMTTKEIGAGSGLGLSQVHGFVHQSGGAVDIESEPGRGTIVRMYLPAAKAPVTKRISGDPQAVSDGRIGIVVAKVAPHAFDLTSPRNRKAATMRSAWLALVGIVCARRTVGSSRRSAGRLCQDTVGNRDVNPWRHRDCCGARHARLRE